MDRYEIEETFNALDPVSATDDEIRQLFFHMKKTPHFVLVSYRPNHTESFRNCVTGRSGSDHDITDTDDLESLIQCWGALIDSRLRQETPNEYSDYEFTLFRNGFLLEPYTQDYQMLQAHAQADANARLAKRQTAAMAAKINADVAAEDRRIAQEKAKLRELIAQHGVPADLQVQR